VASKGVKGCALTHISLKKMIISYDKKYIFLHCRKTAGSAIKCYLNRYLGKNDILVGGWEDVIKNGGRFNRQFYKDLAHPKCSLNFTTWKIILKSIYEWQISIGTLSNIHKKRYYCSFRNPGHETAQEIRAFDESAWNDFYKFCFVRNPYEKEVSDYIWKVESKERPTSFREFLKNKRGENPHSREGVEFPYKNKLIYTIDGKIAVDYIAKYENILKEMRVICKNIRVPFNKDEFPYAKKIKKYNYKSYYTNEEKKIVEDMYDEEMEQFNYSF
jgi:hypothetical protein